MRFLIPSAGVLLFALLTSSAQERLRVVSSAPLPRKDIHNKWDEWEPMRLGCAQDHTFLMSQVSGLEKSAPVILRLSGNGALLSTVDAERVPGLGKTSLEDFAPGPAGEIYLIAKRVAQQYTSLDEHGRLVNSGRADYPGDWLVHYDKDGKLISRTEIMAAS